jgi:hypothetical protein
VDPRDWADTPLNPARGSAAPVVEQHLFDTTPAGMEPFASSWSAVQSPIRETAIDGAGQRLPDRIVLHVYRQGRIDPNQVAPLALCQRGMMQSLGVSQNQLTKVLVRLTAAGVFAVRRGHVQGQDRRLKIYELTELGVSLGRDLSRRQTSLTRQP